MSSTRSIAAALALVLLPLRADAAPAATGASSSTSSSATASPAMSVTPSPDEVPPAPAGPPPPDERAFLRCVPGVEPCVRPRPARLILGAVGLVLASAGTAYLLFVGDSLRSGDPGGLFIGGGTLATAGALVGALVGLTGGDRRGLPDRLRPSTVGLDYSTGAARRLDEEHPGTLALRFAPNYFFPGGGGRLRLFGHVGGLAGREVDTDPRPQFDAAIPGQTGTHPIALRERRLSVGLGTEVAVTLPYPLLRRSARLGGAELRWRPEVQFRRHSQDGIVIERTMLLPLTIGVRWHLSPRQRFTVYVGPRFDFTATAPLGERLGRGPANVGALYGEAWYDIDVPITDPAKHRTDVAGQVNLGYVHSRFDGRGLNVFGAYGFVGALHAGWQMRIRPRGSPVAAQLGVGGWIGNGFTGVVSAGVVLPDLGGGR